MPSRTKIVCLNISRVSAIALSIATLAGPMQPQSQTASPAEPSGWQPSWKDDSGKWQPPWIGRWEAVALAVGQADVEMDAVTFHSSMTYWKDGWLSTGRWSHIEPHDLTQPLRFDQDATILIEGDCLADITVTGDALVHVLGNLSAKTFVGEHSEVVIGGKVTAEGQVEVGSMVSVFVGGDFDGIARDSGCRWWIGGSMNGSMGTGSPMTRLRIQGDCLGSISPLNKAMLELSVRGFMASDKLNAIADLEYTTFNATIGVSDQPRGVYPRKTGDYKIDNRRESSRWVVHKAKRPAEAG